MAQGTVIQLLAVVVLAMVDVTRETLDINDKFSWWSSSVLPSSRYRRSTAHPHTHLTTPELIKARGYPAEVHQVTTEDGYILEIHRIPHGRSTTTPSPSDEPRVVFLLHGTADSSATFVMNDPDQALGFLLADAGYDVWLGNFRGNLYGRQHVSLSPDEFKFWEFSLNEVARYDMPAMFSHIRKKSGADKISFIGHSSGNSALFAMMDYFPHMNAWVRSMAGMAPVAYAYHDRQGAFAYLSLFVHLIDRKLSDLRIGELFRHTRKNAQATSTLCQPNSPFNRLCSSFLSALFGRNDNYIDWEYLPVIMAHIPAGVGFRFVTHRLQLHSSRRFQAFDYGDEKRNWAEYGRPTPPSYSLSHVTIPVGLFWAENDSNLLPEDVAQTASELPQVTLNYKVPLADFNHVDFLWAENAHTLVYQPLIAFLENYY